MYRVGLSPAALREARRLPPREKERIDRALAELAENPRPSGVRKLRGMEGYRLRVGDYRILYEVDESVEEVTVWRIMSRSDVYRRR